jgi:hypothetical protein
MVEQLSHAADLPMDENPPRYTIVLYIFRSTSLAAISSVLLYPLDWSFADGESSRSRVLGITSAVVWGSATFSIGETDRHGLFTPTSAGIRSAFVSKCTDDAAVEPQRSETAIRTLLQLLAKVDSPEDTFSRSQQIFIQCDHPEDLDVWLREVSWPKHSPIDADYHAAAFLDHSQPWS